MAKEQEPKDTKLNKPNLDNVKTGETNPMPPTITESGDKGAAPLSEEPPPTQPPSTSTEHRWRRFWSYLAKVVATLFGVGSTLIFLLALWDSYRPKITVTTGPVIDPKYPFATTFIIQNQGALPIRNVSFNQTWTYADDTNQARNVVFGINVIPELEPLEQHTLIGMLPVINAPSNAPSQPQPQIIVPMPVEHHSLIYWFDVTYEPQFFHKRKTTIYFFGIWDSETNFQWLPTGHEDIRLENSPDAQLLKNAQAFQEGIKRKLAFDATNNPPKPNKGSVTNGVSGVHDH